MRIQRRNARVNRVTFNERLKILVLGSWPLLHIAAYSSQHFCYFWPFIWLLGKLTIPSAANSTCSKQYVQQTVRRNLYPSLQQANFPYLVVSKNAIKGQRLQLNIGSLLSSWFVWGAIAQQIAVVIIKRIKLAVVYKARGARVNSVLHVKHKATWRFN